MSTANDIGGSGKTGGTAAPWRAVVLTIFPDMFPGVLGQSLVGRALADGVWTLDAIDIRDFAFDRHRSVDDVPFGGGPGMVMKPDVVDAALAVAIAKAPEGAPVLYLSPRGPRFDQERARALAAAPGVVLLCGRFEGVDQRVLDKREVAELSLGDFVLSGGSLRRNAFSTRAFVCCRACWVPPNRWARKASRTDCSNTRNTRAPLRGTAATCRPC